MDRRAAGLILILFGVGLIIWYHRLARGNREILFDRLAGGEA